jgi:hypothetical protein
MVSGLKITTCKVSLEVTQIISDISLHNVRDLINIIKTHIFERASCLITKL